MRWCVEGGGSDGGGGDGDVMKAMRFFGGVRWFPRASGTKECLKSTYGLS